MSSNKQGGSAFGRDEMNLLLGSVGGNADTAGIGTAGTALLQSRGLDSQRTGGSSSQRKAEVDIASLSTAQTAALLQQQQQSKGVAPKASRHRAQRVSGKKRLAHHELLEQELQAQQLQQQQQEERLKKPQAAQQQQQEEQPQSSSDEEGDFAAGRHKRKAHQKRIQLEPQIVTQQDAQQRRRRQQRRRSSSSSSSNSSAEPKRRRRRRREESDSDSDASKDVPERRPPRKRADSSSSSSSSSEDEARQRRLQKRQQAQARTQQEPEIVSKKSSSKGEAPTKVVTSPSNEKRSEEAPKGKQERRKRQESSSSSSSSSGDSSSSDDSSSSSDDEPALAMAKPLFVPKRKRLKLAEEKAETERLALEQEQLAKSNATKRKMESRALVAQVVSASTTAQPGDDVASEDEEALAERMLDDMDDKEEDNERDLWEVRELERLLAEIDRLRKKEQEEAEYLRRSQLTDEQARAEDIASGRYQQPGSNRGGAGAGSDGPKYQQKYFHRGAYYMDEDEFEEDDVRHRAKEYEQGVTESQKSLGDTRKLPKIMQVKQFGRANQSRYQGLAKEDTSNVRNDSMSTLLPLVHHKQPQQQRKTTDIPTHKHKKKS